MRENLLNVVREVGRELKKVNDYRGNRLFEAARLLEKYCVLTEPPTRKRQQRMATRKRLIEKGI